jgi:hypothetical protein
MRQADPESRWIDEIVEIVAVKEEERSSSRQSGADVDPIAQDVVQTVVRKFEKGQDRAEYSLAVRLEDRALVAGAPYHVRERRQQPGPKVVAFDPQIGNELF